MLCFIEKFGGIRKPYKCHGLHLSKSVGLIALDTCTLVHVYFEKWVEIELVILKLRSLIGLTAVSSKLENVVQRMLVYE